MFNADTVFYPPNTQFFAFLSAQEMILSFKERTVKLNGFCTRQSDLTPPKTCNPLMLTAAEEKPEAGYVTKVQSAK